MWHKNLHLYNICSAGAADHQHLSYHVQYHALTEKMIYPMTYKASLVQFSQTKTMPQQHAWFWFYKAVNSDQTGYLFCNNNHMSWIYYHSTSFFLLCLFCFIAWKNMTSGDFTVQMLPGTHFYLKESANEKYILDHITKHLETAEMDYLWKLSFINLTATMINICHN